MRGTDWRWPTASCPQCDLRFPAAPVQRFYPHYCRLCTKHRLWLGYRRTIDVGAIPAIRSASRRHHDLTRRFGRDYTHAAFEHAWPASFAWSDGDGYVVEGEEAEILDRLAPGKDRIYEFDPAIDAARYPQHVRIAGLLLSPHWLTIANSEGGWPRFRAELARRCPNISDNRMGTGTELSRWVNSRAAKFHARHIETGEQRPGQR